MTADAVANSVDFSYGNLDDPRDQQNLIDLLFTVTASHQPFADRLFLTNEAHSFEGSTNAGTQTANNIVQVQLDEPVLSLRKGVIASDDPHAVFAPPVTGPVTFTAPGGACPRFSGLINSSGLNTQPVDSDVSHVDAHDLISFGIVVSNTGHSVHGAFDVVISDTLPSGFQAPAGGLKLCVTNGLGDPIAYTGTLTGGLYLQNTGPLTGSLGVFTDTAGTNLALVTFDLQADDTLAAGTYTNTALLENYASAPGGPNFLSKPLTDPATITMLPGLSKQLVATEINNAHNSLTQVVIGELVTYNVGITVPEGVANNVVLTDTLDNGLAFVGFGSLGNSDPGSVTMDHNPPTVSTANNGHTVIFNLGTITDTNFDNSITETLSLTYTAVALNVVGNQGGTQLNNAIGMSYGTNGSLGPVSAANVTVIEPALGLSDTGSPPTADFGDVVTFTLVLNNSGAVDAYGATLTDTLPLAAPGSLLQDPGFSVADSASLVDASNFSLTGSNPAGWVLTTTTPFDMLVSGRRITVTITGTLPGFVNPAELITNPALVRWTSLPGDPGTRSTFNANSTERTGADGPGGALNDYAKAASASILVGSPVPSKVLVASEIENANNARNQAVVGEIITYSLTITMPEGVTPGALFTDTLDNGLAFVGLTSFTNSNPAKVTLDNNPPTVTVSAPGHQVVFNLGTITNTDNDNSVAETINLVYQAVVLDVAGNRPAPCSTTRPCLAGRGIPPARPRRPT